MTDSQGVKSLILHIIGAVALIVGAATGTWEPLVVGTLLYVCTGVLVIRYIAE